MIHRSAKMQNLNRVLKILKRLFLLCLSDECLTDFHVFNENPVTESYAIDTGYKRNIPNNWTFNPFNRIAK